MDIVAGTGEGAPVSAWDPGKAVQNGQTIQFQQPAGFLVLEDMNGDGRLDLVSTGDPLFTFWSGVSVLLGSGDGTFSRHSSVSVPSGAYGVLVGDMNGDVHPDLVIIQGADDPSASPSTGATRRSARLSRSLPRVPHSHLLLDPSGNQA